MDGDVPRATSALLVLVAGDVELVLGSIPAREPDLALVEFLARLQLEAKRRRCSLRVLAACGDLRDLIDLVGLSDVLTDGGEE